MIKSEEGSGNFATPAKLLRDNVKLAETFPILTHFYHSFYSDWPETTRSANHHEVDSTQTNRRAYVLLTCKIASCLFALMLTLILEPFGITQRSNKLSCLFAKGVCLNESDRFGHGYAPMTFYLILYDPIHSFRFTKLFWNKEESNNFPLISSKGPGPITNYNFPSITIHVCIPNR